MIYGIILAGGKGTRMKSKLPKQFLEVSGTPIIVLTLTSFLETDLFDEIYVVVQNTWGDYSRQLIQENFKEHDLDKIKIFPCASINRTTSVYEISNFIMKNINVNSDDIVIIHDSVRPFVTYKILYECIENAKEHKAAMALANNTETMYTYNSNGYLEQSYSKEKIFSGQSPFGCQLNLLNQVLQSYSYEKLKNDSSTLSQLFMNKKINVKTSFGSTENFKITTPIDLAFAEFFWNYKQKLKIQ